MLDAQSYPNFVGQPMHTPPMTTMFLPPSAMQARGNHVIIQPSIQNPQNVVRKVLFTDSVTHS